MNLTTRFCTTLARFCLCVVVLAAPAALGQKRMYWSNSGFGTLERANLDGSSRAVILSGLSSPYAIALDLVHNKIYWTEPSASRLRRANLDGSSVETVATPATPEGVALDAAGGKIYWTRLDDTVQYADLDGSNVVTTSMPGRAIDLDLVNGKMYVCGGGGPLAGSGVRRANLDGSNIETLVAANSEIQYWIAVSPVAGKVLFNSIGNGNGRIVRMNLDGSNQEWSFIVDQFGNLDSNSYGIDFNEQTGQIYWKQGDYTQSRIRRAQSDGSSRVDLVSGTMTGGGLELDLRNTPPVATNLNLVPAFPRTEQNLVASYSYFDVDGDPQSGSEIRWYRNGLLQSAWNDLTTVSNTATTDADAWYFTVRPSDGIDLGTLMTSATVTVSNRAPTTSNLTIIPAFPRPGQDVVASYTYQDLNGDPESGTQLHWFRNGTNIVAYDNTNSVPGAATATADQWYFTVQPSDGSLFGNVVTSAVVTVQNLAPTATNLFITPANPLLNQSLTANYSFNDLNGDAERGTQIRWFRNGIAAPYDDQQTLPPNATSANDVWYFTVRPSDGSLYGSLVQSPSVTVQPDCFLPTNTVSFTSLGTFTTTNLQTGGVTVTAESSPGVSGTVNVLNFNGLGVVGGVFNDTLDSTEALRFQFDNGLATTISYYVTSAGNQNGNGTVGDAFVTGFDANGTSLGTVSVNGSGTKDVSALFANQPLSGFLVRANSDNQRIGSLQYSTPAILAFAQTQFSVSEIEKTPVVKVVRAGSLACVSAVLVNITGGTAQSNVDYVATNFPMNLTFAAGETNAFIPVTPIADALMEGTETVTLSLAPLLNCLVAGITNTTLSITDVPTPPLLGNLTRLGDGSIQFSFQSYTGATFTVRAVTNLALPTGDWTLIGPATEISPGQFQFTDPQATNYLNRFYRVQWP